MRTDRKSESLESLQIWLCSLARPWNMSTYGRRESSQILWLRPVGPSLKVSDTWKTRELATMTADLDVIAEIPRLRKTSLQRWLRMLISALNEQTLKWKNTASLSYTGEAFKKQKSSTDSWRCSQHGVTIVLFDRVCAKPHPIFVSGNVCTNTSNTHKHVNEHIYIYI